MNTYFSIIIPHYNSSTTLERLLKSIPAKLNAQVIVIDDNSTYNEYQKVENLHSLYSFELYHNESKTAGGARNTGLKYATGRWLLFADADDYFDQQLLNCAIKYKDADVDIIYFSVSSRYSKTGEPAYRGNHINELHIKYKKTQNENWLRCCHLSPWGKMIRRNLVEKYHIRYEECIAGNDNWFSVNTGLKARHIIVDDTPIYCVTVSSGSLTTTLNKNLFESKFQSIIRTNKFLRDMGRQKYQISILYFLATAHQFGVRYMMHIFAECLRNKVNPFIGIKKLLHPQKSLRQRQNKHI